MSTKVEPKRIIEEGFSGAGVSAPKAKENNAGKSSIKSANAGSNSSCCIVSGIKNCIMQVYNVLCCKTNYSKIQKQLEKIVDCRANYDKPKAKDEYAKLIGDLSKSVKNEIRETALQFLAFTKTVQSQLPDGISDDVIGFNSAMEDVSNKGVINSWIAEHGKEDENVKFVDDLFTDLTNSLGDSVFRIYLKQVEKMNAPKEEKPVAAVEPKSKEAEKTTAASKSPSLLTRFIRFITCGACCKTEKEKTIELVQELIKFRIETQKLKEKDKIDAANAKYEKLVDKLPKEVKDRFYDLVIEYFVFKTVPVDTDKTGIPVLDTDELVAFNQFRNNKVAIASFITEHPNAPYNMDVVFKTANDAACNLILETCLDDLNAAG